MWNGSYDILLLIKLSIDLNTWTLYRNKGFYMLAKRREQ